MPLPSSRGTVVQVTAHSFTGEALEMVIPGAGDMAQPLEFLLSRVLGLNTHGDT